MYAETESKHTEAPAGETPETAGPACPFCLEEFTPSRKNQKYCCAQCNRDDRRKKSQIAKQQRTRPTRNCLWCGDPFEAKRQDHDHCSPKCRQAFNNWCKGWGGRLVKTVLAWRYFGRKPGGFTAIAHLATEIYDDLKKRRAKNSGKR